LYDALPYSQGFIHRAIASPTQPEGGEKILGGAKYLSSILKFEVKSRRKSAEEAKTQHNICCLLQSVLFFKVIK